MQPTGPSVDGMWSSVVAGLGFGLALIVAIGAQNAFVLRQGLRRERVGAVVAVCALSDLVLIAVGVAGVGTVIASSRPLTIVMTVLGAGVLLTYGALAARRAVRGDAALDVTPTPHLADRHLAPVPAPDAVTQVPVGGVRAGSGSGSAPGSALASAPGSAASSHPAERTLAPVPDVDPVSQVPVGGGAGSAQVGRRWGGVVATAFALTWLNPHVYLDTVVLLGSVAAGHGDARWWFAAGAGVASVAWFTTLGYGAALLRPVFARPGAWRVLDAGIALVMVGIATRLVVELVGV